MQLKLINSEPQRIRPDYPQVNYVDKNGVQWIELNRGCKRQCAFCYSDPNFKVFTVPEIISNHVQIIGEGILYDMDILMKFEELGKKKVNGRVVYYGLSQGVDYRLLREEHIKSMIKNRIGLINGHGNWYKGIRIAWDGGYVVQPQIKLTLDGLVSYGYNRKAISVFVLTNWKIPYSVCMQKLEKLKEWGVKIDDCTYNTTKREMNPIFWTLEELKDFRRKCRKHNQLILFNGYDPESKKKNIDARIR